MPTFADVTLTYLEMTSAPGSWRPLPDGCAVTRLHEPTVDAYRALYDAVGAPWHWADRRVLSDAELREAIDHPDVHVLVLYCEGRAAGFAELSLRERGEVQIVYFGLMPDVIGRGLGRPFLDSVLRKAWAEQAVRRVWLHTCSLDHPAALPLYRAAGFAHYATRAARQRLLED